MHPSTHQTALGASVAGPAGPLALVLAGSVGLVATFWDDAWHTDLGRDQATIPPHLLLYASMATIAAGNVLYALGALLLALIIRQDRGPAQTQPVLHAARTRGAATHGGGVGHRQAPGRLGP